MLTQLKDMLAHSNWGRWMLALLAALSHSSAFAAQPPQESMPPSRDGPMPTLIGAYLADENGLPMSEQGEILSSPLDVLKTLLSKHSGIIISRLDRAFSDIEFLTQHMGDFAAAGVTKFYCPFVKASDQALLDRFYRTGNNGPEIKQYFNERYSKEQTGSELATRSNLYYRLINAARQAKVQVIGIDNELQNNSPDGSMISNSEIVKNFEAQFSGKSIFCTEIQST